MNTQNWIQTIVGVIILGTLGWLATTVFDLSSRLSSLEGQFNTLMQLRSEFQDLQTKVSDAAKELESIQKKVSDVAKKIESTKPDSKGRILKPRSGATITHDFDYRVQLWKPNPNSFYYLAVQAGGKYWPKAIIEPVSDGGEAFGQINEGGSKPFYLVLIEVNEDEHKSIQQWMQGPLYEGRPREGRELDRVRLSMQ